MNTLYYDILRSPVVTEKATYASEQNKVVFYVRPDATKPLIKSAVEALFKVKVEAVNTSNLKGKVKRLKGRAGRRADRKKAVVTLAAGQTIDLTSVA
jgi:large subunit ribosomal protein L23